MTAFFAGNGFWIFRSDPLNFSAVSCLTVARIAGDHAIFVQEMQVAMAALRFGVCLHLLCGY
jgi:hypothetical protein